MKILNGNRYFEKKDVIKYYKTACNSLMNPALIEETKLIKSSFSVEFLYSADNKALIAITQGINKLNNTLSWEFSSETALNLSQIEKCYFSLRTPASNKMNYTSFKAILPQNITSDVLTKHENWLNDVGIDIFFSFFTT